MVNTGSPALQALQAPVEFATGPAFNAGTFTAGRLRVMLLDMVRGTWPHSYSKAMQETSSAIVPRHVRIVPDVIAEYPNAPASGAELAAISGISLRSLQAEFLRFAGMSIAACQRQVRLERTPGDLLQSLPLPIEDIALKWRLSNTGHFSRYFREAYGVSPWAVARNGAAR